MTGIDTNVLIYACDTASPAKQARATEVISETEDGVLIWQVACEFVAASRKLAPQGFTPTEAWARLTDLLALFPLILPTQGVIEKAREFHVARQVSFWDSMLLGACVEAGVGRLYSEDLPGGAVEGVEVVNPFV